MHLTAVSNFHEKKNGTFFNKSLNILIGTTKVVIRSLTTWDINGYLMELSSDSCENCCQSNRGQIEASSSSRAVIEYKSGCFLKTWYSCSHTKVQECDVGDIIFAVSIQSRLCAAILDFSLTVEFWSQLTKMVIATWYLSTHDIVVLSCIFV